MRKKIIVSIVVFLVLILAGVAIWGFSSGKFAGWADTGPAEIDIFTHDSNNNTVGFVDILVSSDNQNYSSVGQTQSNGHLIYQDLAFQNHTLYLKASKPYHSVSPEYRQLSVSSGNKYNTDFTVTPIAQDLTKGKLKGRVTESGTTNPINGAFIYVSNDKTGFSNAQGDYGIADINPGTYDVKVRRNDYQDAHSTAIISAGQETTLNFTLTKKSSPTPTPSNSSSPSPSTQPDSTKFTFIAEIVDAANTNSLVGGAKVEISPNPIINNVYGWEETSTDQPADETKYDKVNLKRANLVAEDLLQPTPDCNSKNTTYTVTYTHPDYQTYTPQTFNCGEIKFDQKLQTYLYNAGRVELKKIPLLSIKGTVSSYS
ncbi:MAG: carboxypeptidase-like regulatory domain-containing protein, partial [Candidatus Berkelbacteria bacterium]|nr:carboxypeptidase-like regulatory domain-containing protein [Candidatus Berkelbacteria bacterium]